LEASAAGCQPVTQNLTEVSEPAYQWERTTKQQQLSLRLGQAENQTPMAADPESIQLEKPGRASQPNKESVQNQHHRKHVSVSDEPGPQLEFLPKDTRLSAISKMHAEYC
jgi:hypothetical protein